VSRLSFFEWSGVSIFVGSWIVHAELFVWHDIVELVEKEGQQIIAACCMANDMPEEWHQARTCVSCIRMQVQSFGVSLPKVAINAE